MCQEHWKEREIGVTIEKVGKRSCLDATELEKNLCRWNSSAANKEGVVISKLVMTWVGKEKVLVKHITVAQGCCFDTDRKRKDLELWDTN